MVCRRRISRCVGVGWGWVDWFKELICVGRGELASAIVRDKGWVDWRRLGGGALHCDVGGRKHRDAEAAKSLGNG